MLIAATGVYASLDHLWGPGALTGTPYGRVLLIKLAVVSIVAAVAAVNRWVLIPSLTRGATAERLGGLVVQFACDALAFFFLRPDYQGCYPAQLQIAFLQGDVLAVAAASGANVRPLATGIAPPVSDVTGPVWSPDGASVTMSIS